jgi:hypothetical protein
MEVKRPVRAWQLPLALGLLLAGGAPDAQAYITNPVQTLGQLCGSTYITVVRVDKVSKEKGVIIYRKVHDLKGKYPTDTIRHAFDLKNTPQHKGPGDVPIRPDEKEWTYAIQWAEPGKTAVMFTLKYDPYGDFGHTYIDKCWYATMCPKRDWDFWYSIYSDPALLRRWHCGTPAQLVSAVEEMLAGKDSVVPVVAEGSKEDLRAGLAKIQGLRVSLGLNSFDPKRDALPWRGSYLKRLSGLPGFTHLSAIEPLDGDVLGVSLVDTSGSGNCDLCLVGTNRVAVALNGGDSTFSGIKLPAATGARAAVWADYNGDGKPDLLLATPTGPRLFTNLGAGIFRDDTHLLPKEAAYDLTAAAWIDYDGDGRPDILLGNGYHGLRLYRNKGRAEPLAGPTPPGQEPPTGHWFEDVSTRVGLGPDGIGSAVKGDTLTVCDVNGDGRLDFLYGAGSGILVLNTPRGFVEAKNCGIRYKPGKVGPVFGDFDNSGAPSLFVPQLAGGCKLFKNDGKGQFTDITARTGDLARFTGTATCAAWGDVDNDGHLDLVVGCLRGPNQLFRNKGDGTFEDATEALGLHKRIFNTQGISLVDLNHDGVLDLVCNNQGQESVVLFGNRQLVANKKTPLTIQVTGRSGVMGSRVRLLDADGNLLGLRDISGGDGRGGQQGPHARFAVAAGKYQVEVRSSSGVVRAREVRVETAPVRVTIELD